MLVYSAECEIQVFIIKESELVKVNTLHFRENLTKLINLLLMRAETREFIPVIH